MQNIPNVFSGDTPDLDKSDQTNNQTYINLDELPYDLNLLRGWQKTQLKILKNFAATPNGIAAANASTSNLVGRNLGGEITPLTRSRLISKVGRDDKGNQLWKLNEKRVDKDKLKAILADMKV